MKILVTYASKHGSTQEIAERIEAVLRAEGLESDLQPVTSAGDLTRYDAVVVGSAVYFGSWRKEAVKFIQENRDLLADRPVWLFSSGPLGTDETDETGQDLREAAVPKQIDEFRDAITPHDHRVFFGALEREDFGITEKIISALPAGRKLLQEGDFRDWNEIDAWAKDIAREIAQLPATLG